MPHVRLLVGTRKGAFVITARDASRTKWDVAGPFFGGWEIYHVKGSPVDPDLIYASQSSSWFGQVIQRSSDGGRTWDIPDGSKVPEPGPPPESVSNAFKYDTAKAPLTTHQWYDGTQHPWEFKRVWHLEPSLTDANVVYAGVEDAAMFKSTNRGASWTEQAALRLQHGEKWMPGAGGMGLHTIVIDPTNPQRIFIAISAAGAFRSDDGGEHWKPINRGLKSNYIPDDDAAIGHCVHRIAQHPKRPDTLYMQKHWDVMRSNDAGEHWHEISGNLPSDFGFPIDVHAHEPDWVYVVPIKSDAEHYPPDGKLRVYRSKQGGNEWEALTDGLPQENCFVNILRDAMCVDTLDDSGIYFGTTGGTVYCSPDGGDTWHAVVRDLPAVLSVEVQTLR